MINLSAFIGFASFALLFGFANTSFFPGNCRRTARVLGTIFGTLLSLLVLLIADDWTMALCLFASALAGSLIAAETPAANPLKRFFQE